MEMFIRLYYQQENIQKLYYFAISKVLTSFQRQLWRDHDMHFYSSDPQIDLLPTIVRVQMATEIFYWEM